MSLLAAFSPLVVESVGASADGDALKLFNRILFVFVVGSVTEN